MLEHYVEPTGVEEEKAPWENLLAQAENAQEAGEFIGLLETAEGNFSDSQAIIDWQVTARRIYLKGIKTVGVDEMAKAYDARFDAKTREFLYGDLEKEQE